MMGLEFTLVQFGALMIICVTVFGAIATALDDDEPFGGPRPIEHNRNQNNEE